MLLKLICYGLIPTSLFVSVDAAAPVRRARQVDDNQWFSFSSGIRKEAPTDEPSTNEASAVEVTTDEASTHESPVKKPRTSKATTKASTAEIPSRKHHENGTPSLRSECLTQHPAHRVDATDLTVTEWLECYALWHDATLAAWGREPNKCEGRYAMVLTADHGLGDSGGKFVNKFFNAMLQGDMIFWDFRAPDSAGTTPRRKTVWELAMVQPFKWDIRDSMHLFCLENHHLNRLGYNMVKCPTCQDRVVKDSSEMYKYPGFRTLSGNAGTAALWKFLYRPTNDVQQVVQETVGKLKKDERLIGVHFRAQWFGNHGGCGCLDSQEAPKCMANLGNVLQERAIPGFESRPRLRFFVASDEFAGLDAFRETFRDELITLPDTLPLEHSLDSSAAGAKRIFAEYLVLQKASAIIGTCGSTFSETVIHSSGLPANATIITGTLAAHACAAGNSSPHNFKAFNVSRFANVENTWTKRCGCYGEEEHSCGPECERESSGGRYKRGPTCDLVCKGGNHEIRLADLPRPSHCSRPKSLMELARTQKPEWIPQRRV